MYVCMYVCMYVYMYIYIVIDIFPSLMSPKCDQRLLNWKITSGDFQCFVFWIFTARKSLIVVARWGGGIEGKGCP